MRKRIYYLIALMLLFNSCQLVVDIKVPDEPPQLTLNSVFHPDSVWRAQLSLNRYILSTETFRKIDDALIIISANNVPIDTLVSLGNGEYKGKTKPQLNQLYSIQATSSYAKSVSATALILPRPVEILNVTLEPQQLDTKISFDLTDPAEEENFYSISILDQHYYYPYHSSDSVLSTDPTNITSNNPSIKTDYSGGTELIFSDITFNGKTINILVHSNDIYIKSKTIIQLKMLSKDLYQYKTTVSLQAKTEYDPLAQPVNVFNNIKDGFGIFAGYSETKYFYTP